MYRQRIVMLTGHSHMSEVYSIKTADAGDFQGTEA
jgi:hypothetical protein